MRKGIIDRQGPMIPLSVEALQKLGERGFKFVQVRGFTSDWHYEYIEPSLVLLFPLKELPRDAAKKDIYEPVGSPRLLEWALERNSDTTVLIRDKH